MEIFFGAEKPENKGILEMMGKNMVIFTLTIIQSYNKMNLH